MITSDDARRLQELARRGEKPSVADLRKFADALREIGDRPRLALFRKLLREHGPRELVEILTMGIAADGYPAPKRDADMNNAAVVCFEQTEVAE